MPILDGIINGFVCGDALDIKRTVKNIPNGQIIDTARLIIKAGERDTTPLLHKTITIVPSSSGVINDNGSSGTGSITFTLSGEDTAKLLPDEDCYYWISILTSAGKPYTPDKGIIHGEINDE